MVVLLGCKIFLELATLYTLYTGYSMNCILLPLSSRLGTYVEREPHLLCRLHRRPLQSAHHSVNSGWKTHDNKDARKSID